MSETKPTECPNCGHDQHAHYFDMDSDQCGVCACPGWFSSTGKVDQSEKPIKREHSLAYCSFSACHVGGSRCPYVANPKCRPAATSPSGEQKAELHKGNVGNNHLL